ncbi:unnamed protein product [Mytilus edulis]|uniref:Uncharacterized protein n=1 Tax=Mytilus edulis TaxID=6550 RepID=A0A8S3R5P0_MYTED|nr:unnamed protein product [Mytilus edulis]
MDDNQVLKHSEIQKKISMRQNEIKDLVSSEGLELLCSIKEIWGTENNPVSTERKRLSQIEQELRARNFKLVSLGDDICVIHSTTSRKIKYFTISGPSIITTKVIIDENKKGDKENSTTFLDLTKCYGDILLSDMRRLKNSGIFENLSLSCQFYSNIWICWNFEIKINKHNDVCLMKRMEWNSLEYETLFSLPVTSQINDTICVIDRPNSKGQEL